METGLRGKTALVGGASHGIGYAAAHMLASEGMQVAMVARREPALTEAAARIAGETGATVHIIPADIRKAADCERMIDATIARFGSLHVLVNNDGAPPLGAILDFDDVAWDKAVQQNLMSVVRLSRRAVPHMRTAGYGRIINVTALSVLQPLPRIGLSIATWAAVLGFAKTLSLEIAAEGITVHTICPGRIETGRDAKAAASEADLKMMEETRKLIPMGRVGTPEEMAGLITFLASQHSSFMTGCVHHVDGGRHNALF